MRTLSPVSTKPRVLRLPSFASLDPPISCTSTDPMPLVLFFPLQDRGVSAEGERLQE
jgi:hypothetical protein